MYEFGEYSQDETFSFPSAGTIVSERLPNHTSSFLYTVNYDDVAEFKMVFGVSPEAMDERSSLERWEQESIASWLTGHKKYGWLEIYQDDMSIFRYRCIISELTVISVDGYQWAFQCKVTCDSPYGYTYPEITTFSLNGSDQQTIFKNRSSCNEDFYPIILIEMHGGNSITINNNEFDDSNFQLTDLPGQSYTIRVDNDNQIITSEELPDFNFYEHFNFEFFRLKRGDNLINFSGNGIIKFICSYPVNIGG